MREDDINPHPTEEQFQQMFREAVLRHYPNPERKGCLDSPIITAIAQQPLPHEDSRWEHISHCSPCYREFLNSRNELLEHRTREKAQKRLVIRLAILVAAGILLTLVVMAIRRL